MRLAIFDVDGTLVDSRALIHTCMEMAFTACGHRPPTYDETRRIVGLSLAPALDQLAPGVDEAGRRAILEAYRDAFVAVRSDPERAERVYDGIDTLLGRLAQADGWLLAIATGKSRRGLDMILERHNWRRHFVTTWCADDGPGKPHPHMVTQAMAATGIEPGRSVMIGDSEHDMAMARAAGCAALGVSWGFGTIAEMRAAGAHDVLDRVVQLGPWLEAWAG